MRKLEQLRIVYISYVIGIVFSFILSYFKKINFEYYGVIGAIKVSTILSVWWYFYFNIGWKIVGLNQILYKINLNGTWYGTYESVGSNTQKISKGDIVIRIKQNFLETSVISYTEKYNNYSHSEELKYDEKSDINGLIYVYSQKENSPLDLSERNGTAELQILKNEDTYKLYGEFWTILGTKGKLDLVRVSKKIVDSFELGKKLHKDYINKKQEEK
jgi:hypothetical protein